MTNEEKRKLEEILPPIEEYKERIKNCSPDEQKLLIEHYYTSANEIELVKLVDDLITHFDEQDEVFQKIFDNIFSTLKNHKEGIDDLNEAAKTLIDDVERIDKTIKCLSGIGIAIAIILSVFFIGLI